MKIRPCEIQALRDAIAPLDTDTRRAVYLSGEFPRADKVKDLDKRYRWDLFYDARRVVGFDAFDFVSDYEMDHLDTALRSVVARLVK